MVAVMTRTITTTAPQDDQSWLINRITDNVREGQLDLALFTTRQGDASQPDDNYRSLFASISDDSYDAWLYSGIPVARVSDSGLYGPYDPAATDGRQQGISGFLESSVHVEFTRNGFADPYPTVGIRYMGVIDYTRVPHAVDIDWATVNLEGSFLAYKKNATDSQVRPLGATGTTNNGGGAAATIPQGALIPGDGISLTRDAQTGAITTSIKAKGVTTGMIADGVIPGAYTLPAASTSTIGGVKQAVTVGQVTVADPAGAAGDTPTKAEFKALLDYAKALKTTVNQLIAALSDAGILAPKA